MSTTKINLWTLYPGREHNHGNAWTKELLALRAHGHHGMMLTKLLCKTAPNLLLHMLFNHLIPTNYASMKEAKPEKKVKRFLCCC